MRMRGVPRAPRSARPRREEPTGCFTASRSRHVTSRLDYAWAVHDFVVLEPLAEGADKNERYLALRRYVDALTVDEPDWLANLANVAAAIYEHVPGLNWAGFYLMRGEELVLGPFQGRPACIRIAVGRGVCGTAAATQVSQVVPDVSQFPGHIACDSRSRSEIVVPIVIDGRTVGVLDLDSDKLRNFDIEDRRALETIVNDLEERLDWAGATRV